MKSSEIVDSNLLCHQLERIVHGGEIDPEETTKNYRQIDGHPLLGTSNLIGSVLVSLSTHLPGMTGLKLDHKAEALVDEKEYACISSSTLLIARSGVLLQVFPSVADDISILTSNLDDLLYAQQAYLPRQIIAMYHRSKGAARVGAFYRLEKMPELLDFIQGTYSNLAAKESAG